MLARCVVDAIGRYVNANCHPLCGNDEHAHGLIINVAQEAAADATTTQEAAAGANAHAVIVAALQQSRQRYIPRNGALGRVADVLFLRGGGADICGGGADICVRSERLAIASTSAAYCALRRAVLN